MKKLFSKKQTQKIDFFTFKKYEIKNIHQIIGGNSGEEYAEDVDLEFNLTAY